MERERERGNLASFPSFHLSHAFLILLYILIHHPFSLLFRFCCRWWGRKASSPSPSAQIGRSLTVRPIPPSLPPLLMPSLPPSLPPLLTHFLLPSLPMHSHLLPLSFPPPPPPGEELTMDYCSFTHSEEEYLAAVCLCGSHTCR